MSRWMNKMLLVAVPAFFLSLLGCQHDSPQTEKAHDRGIAQTALLDSVWLIIDYSGDRTDTLGTAIARTDSLNVLELLMTLAAGDSIAVETRNYAIGTMVEQIGNRANGEGGYWLYTVNNQPIPLAASDCLVSPGDTIRFFFE